ncbi:hypothetical protein AM501_29545 [Aneurinibacillus migulanus]|uniref:hypothetical protein n=1 Tax=Aneurinibacillus migulanus TaxID=47500 RepID=UPI0005BBA4E3|nr:hypothetical protein [Aneurinibacillus migulanus]KIV57406.1 hypothetical protein TS64_07175 [Aneurinibacillus migulanus]KPD04822.1 hypothetical protein AM501_29545 [Aneurinibacillus migulanus]
MGMTAPSQGLLITTKASWVKTLHEFAIRIHLLSSISICVRLPLLLYSLNAFTEVACTYEKWIYLKDYV